MERMSDKHSPRVDEAMAHEVESLVDGNGGEARSQEGRTQEDEGFDFANRMTNGDAPGIGLSADDANGRAELARHVAGADWPATKQDLLAAAARDHADDPTLVLLNTLPDDPERRYGTVQEVWEAAGGAVEGHHS